MGLFDRFSASGNESVIGFVSRTLRYSYRTGFLSNQLLAPLSAVGLTRRINVRTIYQIHAGNYPNRPALVDDYRSISYQNANQEINRVATALQEDLDVEAGDSVTLALENRCEYLLIWFAILRLGARSVHSAPQTQPDELERRMQRTQSRVLFVSKKSFETGKAVQDRDSGDNLEIISIDDVEPGKGVQLYRNFVLKGWDDFPTVQAADTTGENIVFTSGSTSRPKGIIRNLESQANLSELFRWLDELPMEGGNRHLTLAPLFHSGAQAFVLSQVALGNTIFVQTSFEPEKTLQNLSKRDINSVFMVPEMIREILDLPDELHREFPCENLECLIASAAPFPQPLRKRAVERFGAETIHDIYGATEIGLVTHISGRDLLEKHGSCGRPLAVRDVKILNDNGETVPTGKPGTIYVRNEQSMTEYLSHESTKKSTAEEWISAGDVGYRDEEGHLYVLGRTEEVISTTEGAAYPIEIRNCLEQHDSVNLAGIVGLPQNQDVDEVGAVIVPRGKDVDFDELERFSSERLNSHEVPSRWVSREKLPMTPTGKIETARLENFF